MIRTLICAGLLSAAAFALAPDDSPKFEAADVHVSPHSDNILNQFMKGPQVRTGRYEIHTANMLELVEAAYGIDSDDKVLGGPAWLELDRYEITAKLPAGSTPDSQKKMLQALLAERFKLVVHNDTKPLPAWALAAGAHPKLKASDPASTDQKGCQTKRSTPEPGAAVQIQLTCHGLTLAEFADRMPQGPAGVYLQKQVVDTTEIKGSYDFELRFTPRPQLALAGTEAITLFDAMDKQLGLKLDAQKVPMPVLVVDSANETPTANPADIATMLPGVEAPTEFEVATVKPTPDDYQGIRFQVLPSGQVNVQGVNLRFIFQQAWGILSDDMLVGAPKWLSEDRFDIIAKAPKATLVDGTDGPPVDFDEVMGMLKNLLVQRFKLQTHMEDRPISAYSLMAAKPKMKPADPNGRIHCINGPGPDEKDPRETNPVLNRLLHCQNMTMVRFASMLQGLASGYIHAPVLDATGLDGAYDFTLSFSGAGQLPGGANGGGRGGRGGDAPAAATQIAATDPNGAVSLPDAIQKQLGLRLELSKRPVKVLVIDHIEEKPTDN